MDSESLPAAGDSTEKSIEELSERTLQYWMTAVSTSLVSNSIMHELQNSISWKITKPLRVVRSLQLRAAQIGYRRAARLAVERLKRARLDKARDR